MVEGPLHPAADLERGADAQRAVQVGAGLADRLVQGEALGEPRSDGGSKRAAYMLRKFEKFEKFRV